MKRGPLDDGGSSALTNSAKVFELNLFGLLYAVDLDVTEATVEIVEL